MKRIQNKITDLISAKDDEKSSILLEDCCSELSRLVAGWIRSEDSVYRLLILKGEKACGTIKSHDILAIVDSTQKVFLIDPTIWQFFPDATSIFVSTEQDFNSAFKKITNIYFTRIRLGCPFLKV